MTARAASLMHRFDELAQSEAGRRTGMLLLFAVIGVELMALHAWLPDTINVWRDPDAYGYGDFPSFYNNAERFSFNALYSPGLTVLMHPLTYLDMRDAFAIYFGVNVAALLGIAYIAQRAVSSLPAKAAVALGVLALPQTHWALRVGHFTEVLALAALCGLLLSDRRPIVAGLLIGLIALKPQYLPVPLLFLLWTRNWRAFGTTAGALALLGASGIAAMIWLEGGNTMHMLNYTAGYYGEAMQTAARFLTLDQRDHNYAQGWQYSWYGFLVSAGIDRNPLIAGELIALSIGCTLLCWWRCSISVAKAATVLGMLLVTPHTSFYNWSMLAVFAALLLHSDLRPRYLAGGIIGGLAIAAVATQEATPFPLPRDAFRPAGTYGLYWIQPASLAALAALAIIGKRTAESEPAAAREPRTTQPLRNPAVRPAAAFAYASAAFAAISVGYVASAYVSGNPPFNSDPYFGRSQVMQALPADFPLPEGAVVGDAGSGAQLPYRIQFTSDAPVNEVAGVMRRKLDHGSWRMVEATADADAVSLQSARTQTGDTPVVARLWIRPSGTGSAVRVEFSPIPAASVPGYDEWLRRIGLVVHNVDPALLPRESE